MWDPMMPVAPTTAACFPARRSAILAEERKGGWLVLKGLLRVELNIYHDIMDWGLRVVFMAW